MRLALDQASWEARAIFRNGEQLMVAFIMPIIALVALLHIDALGLPEPQNAHALAGALAMAVIASSFTSQSIAVAFDRRWGVLRMFATTPLGPRGLLAGKAIAVVIVVAAQVIVLCLIAALLGGWRPASALSIIAMAIMIALGTVTFVALGMCVGGTLRTEAVLAVANIGFVLMVIAGGVLMPVGSGLTGWFLTFTPFGALGEGMRAAVLGEIALLPIVVQAAWAALLSAVAVRVFRWES
ncbi:ABC transporter permease [Bowdeniella massiliensis]|uniref:ABC transporter permease n=1 Tax=Bowdeniella massiliensis TaxID=2932264 RepID=UPI002029341B|nr:ABC transporter permease [Bowdeniella massiliensis]